MSSTGWGALVRAGARLPSGATKQPAVTGPPRWLLCMFVQAAKTKTQQKKK